MRIQAQQEKNRTHRSRTLRGLALAAMVAVAGACADATGPGGKDDPIDTTPDAVPNAGNDLITARGATVTLDGSGSSDPQGAQITYTWTQIWGPSVTNGNPALAGVSPSFTAPLEVSTILFELRVSDGNGDNGMVDTVQVDVLENDTGALYVDGDNGSDADGDGSRANPFGSISGALARASGDQDLYVMTRAGGAAYEESSTLEVPTGTSIYGGYGPDWRRDPVANRTIVNGASTAVRVGPVNENAWISGLHVTASSTSEAGASVFGLMATEGSAALTLEDNAIFAGDAGNGEGSTGAGSSYGVLLFGLSEARVRRNQIEAGRGGDGVDGSRGSNGSAAASAGGNGRVTTRGSAGSGALSSNGGGRGGTGGSGFLKDAGGAGESGGSARGGGGGRGGPEDGGSAHDGDGGAGGAGGAGGTGGDGRGGFTDEGVFVPANGSTAGNGTAGGGGGGGGGGRGVGLGIDGGGGGGGGGGGQGGHGGRGGTGGGASVGLAVQSVGQAHIEQNTILAGTGGVGGDGGSGGSGGNGKSGGTGAIGECAAIGCWSGQGGEGAEGGGGGKGGQGGQGGGGAGGASYGVVIGHDTGAELTGNQITSGVGGKGGGGGTGGLAGEDGSDGGSVGGNGGDTHVGRRGTHRPAGTGGWSFAVWDADPNDDFTPTLSGNTLTAGTGGAGGPGTAPGTSGQTGEHNNGS